MNPLNLIPAPYRILATVGLLVAFVGSVYAFAYAKGFKSATADCDAGKLAAVQKYQIAGSIYRNQSNWVLNPTPPGIRKKITLPVFFLNCGAGRSLVVLHPQWQL